MKIAMAGKDDRAVAAEGFALARGVEEKRHRDADQRADGDCTKARAKMPVRMRRGSAPSADRMPISRRRCETANARVL